AGVLEGGDEVGDADVAAGRLVDVALGLLAERLARDDLVVHTLGHPRRGVGEKVRRGRVEAVLAVSDGVLEDEAEVAVVPDVEEVRAVDHVEALAEAASGFEAGGLGVEAEGVEHLAELAGDGDLAQRRAVADEDAAALRL